MVIDFMGLPGVGKSYLGKQIEKELSQRDVKCISVIERSRSLLGWRILSKCFHIIISAIPNCRRLKFELANIVKSHVLLYPKYNYDSVRITDYIEQIVFLHYVYAKLESSSSVYIFDEGMAQQFANIIVNFGVDVDVIQKMLLIIGKLPRTVYITYSIEKIKEAIATRNRHVCYIDELKGKELDQYLVSYQKVCDSISSIIQTLKIDRTMDNSQNLEKVVEAIIG